VSTCGTAHGAVGGADAGPPRGAERARRAPVSAACARRLRACPPSSAGSGRSRPPRRRHPAGPPRSPLWPARPLPDPPPARGGRGPRAGGFGRRGSARPRGRPGAPPPLASLPLFGAGTITGLLVITVAIAVPFALTARRFIFLHRSLAFTAGVLSVGFGLFLVYQIGFIGGLFTGEYRWTPQ